LLYSRRYSLASVSKDSEARAQLLGEVDDGLLGRGSGATATTTAVERQLRRQRGRHGSYDDSSYDN
jgi:hypothetical protein